jgi:DNA-binding NtrC family response regulator
LSTARRRILVVSDTLALANNLLLWLREAGYDPAVVTSFNAGKEHLRTAPDILITELKLREYNGLHLALRAHRDGIPTAVIGADPRYASDAQEIGARYVVGDNVHRDDILLLVDGLLSARTISPPTPIEWTVSATDGAGDEGLGAGMDWHEDLYADIDRVSSSPVRPVIH